MYTGETPLEIFGDTIDLSHLCNKYPEFTNYLIHNPIEYQHILYNKTLINLPSCLLIPASLTNKNYNKLVRIEGTMIKVGPVLYKNIQETLFCVKCKVEVIKMKKKKAVCAECHGSTIEKKQNIDKIKTYQSIRIQDVKCGGSLRTIEVIFEGKSRSNERKIIPGDRVIVTGVVMLNLLTENPRVNEHLKYNYCLKGIGIEVISEDDINDVDNFYERFLQKDGIDKRKHAIKLFCPEIHGYNHIKLGLILTLLGKSFDEARQNSHLLMIGDPGLGKTRLLRFCSYLITPSRFINGISTSEVGLTACAVRTDRDWSLEAGALVVSDGGICCIDNFNDLNIGEKGGLLEAMEQQTVSIAKAGMNVKFKARCSVIAASGYKNPRKFLSGFDLKNNVNLSTPLLSRFDLIFGVFEKKNVSYDEAIADIILSNKNNLNEFKEIKTLINILRRIEIVKEVPEVVKEIIFKYYQYKKKHDKANDEFNTIRMIEGLLRLAHSHSKLVVNEEVSIDDSIVAILLNEISIRGKRFVSFDEELVFLSDEYFHNVKNQYLKKIYE